MDQYAITIGNVGNDETTQTGSAEDCLGNDSADTKLGMDADRRRVGKVWRERKNRMGVRAFSWICLCSLIWSG